MQKNHLILAGICLAQIMTPGSAFANQSTYGQTTSLNGGEVRVGDTSSNNGNAAPAATGTATTQPKEPPKDVKILSGPKGMTAVSKGAQKENVLYQAAIIGGGAFCAYKSATKMMEFIRSCAPGPGCSQPQALVESIAWGIGVGAAAMLYREMQKDKKAGADVMYQGVNYGGLAGNDPELVPGSAAYLEQQAAGLDKAIQKLATKGIIVSKKDGSVTYKGKTYKQSDFKSPAAAAAAGIPISPSGFGAVQAGMQKAMADSMAAAKKALNTDILSEDSGGGGGGGGGGAGMTASLGGADGGFAFPQNGGAGAGALGRNPAQAAAAGMKKNFNGEPIGVAQDSIFLMMNRRYQLKAQQENFITGAPAVQMHGGHLNSQ